MAITNDFYIGTGNTEDYDFFPLSFWMPNADEPIDPDEDFQPFSESIRLASGNLLGVGFPFATWQWNAIKNENIEILRQFCPYPALTADNIYIRTPTKQITSSEIVWKTFVGKMNWPAPSDEQREGDKTINFQLVFTHLVLAE